MLQQTNIFIWYTWGIRRNKFLCALFILTRDVRVYTVNAKNVNSATLEAKIQWKCISKQHAPKDT